MSIVTNKKYTGQKQDSVLSGEIRTEEGSNRTVIYDASTGNYITFGAHSDGFGIAYYDSNEDIIKTDNGKREIRYRNGGIPYFISGVLPDGSLGTVISKEGINVISLFS